MFTKSESFYKFVGFLGPRSCLGMSLARVELFLYFTFLLQTFTFRLAEADEQPSLEPRYGINMSPQVYRLIATPR